MILELLIAIQINLKKVPCHKGTLKEYYTLVTLYRWLGKIGGSDSMTTAEKFVEDLSVLHHLIRRNKADISNKELIEQLIYDYHRNERIKSNKPRWENRAKAIKSLRTFLGLSQDQVARLMGVSQKSVSYAEGNNWRCSDELQEKVLETLLIYQQKIS